MTIHCLQRIHALKFRCAPVQNKFKIIRCLLENESVTQPDLAVYCGYERKQVSNIQTDIQKLKNSAIITEAINAPSANQRGRPPKSYRLVKSVENIRTINRLAEQLSSYDEAKIYAEVIRRTPWVQEKIIQELLDPSIGHTFDEVDEIRAMLALSPYFFETALGGDTGIKIDVNKVACFWSDYLHPERDRSPSTSSCDYQRRDIELPSNAFQDLFAFCLFVDRSRGLDSEESWRFLEHLSDNRRDEVRGTSGR